MNIDDVSIREATESDRYDIGSVHNAAIAESAGYSQEREDLLRFVDDDPLERLYTTNVTYVAEVDDRIVGWGSYFPSKDCIDGLFVHPDYQSIGIGSELLNKIEEAARNDNTIQLLLAANPHVTDYYENKGYIEVEKKEMESINEDGYVDCVVMVKFLAIN